MIIIINIDKDNVDTHKMMHANTLSTITNTYIQEALTENYNTTIIHNYIKVHHTSHMSQHWGGSLD